MGSLSTAKFNKLMSFNCLAWDEDNPDSLGNFIFTKYSELITSARTNFETGIDASIRKNNLAINVDYIKS